MDEKVRRAAQQAIERGLRVDRLIPAPLLDSPVSLVGYWWGTAVGWIWGALWSTGRVQRRGGMWVFRGLPPWAFARGGVCVGGCFLTGERDPSDTVLRHEYVHRRQWRRYGFLMPVLYLLAGRDPLRNRFEIEAGLIDGGYLRPQRRPRGDGAGSQSRDRP
ncbi:Fe-S oxidoreductase [Microbacterium sp. USHLN186]|uniref:Fe-S oxidoreductase n=1 Tax=Microbacterium sp. USHLN186 TaxID=3081286 RepID=UPI00301A7D0B